MGQMILFRGSQLPCVGSREPWSRSAERCSGTPMRSLCFPVVGSALPVSFCSPTLRFCREHGQCSAPRLDLGLWTWDVVTWLPCSPPAWVVWVAGAPGPPRCRCCTRALTTSRGARCLDPRRCPRAWRGRAFCLRRSYAVFWGHQLLQGFRDGREPRRVRSPG